MFGNLFKKKVTIADTRNKAEAERIEKLLHEAGVWAKIYEEHPPVVIGGPHMKSSDWNGKLLEKGRDEERIVYHVEILVEETGKARMALSEDLG